MKRSALREYTFLMLFRVPFHSRKQMQEQEEIYLSFGDDALVREDGFPEPVDEDEKRLLLNQKDKQLVSDRFEKVSEKISEIDALLTENTTGWDVKRIGKVELAILRLAIYEMRYDEDIPKAVAINEAVELAKRYGQEGAPSFVNGVLAKFA